MAPETRMRAGYQRTFLTATVVALTAVAAMGIVAVFADLGDTGMKILATALMVAAAGIVSLASATAKSHRHGLTANGHAGMWAAGLGLAGALALLWGEDAVGDWEWLARTVACLGVVAVAAPHSGLLAIARLRPHMEWARVTTWAATGILTGTLILLFLTDMDAGVAAEKTIAVTAIVVAFGTITIPILHRVSGLSDMSGAVVTVSAKSISLGCPRCGKQHELPLGDSECPSCGLLFKVEISENRCQCGYPKYGLPTTVCPECGRDST